MNEDLHALAQAAGVEVAWRDVNGVAQTVSDDSLRAVLAALGSPPIRRNRYAKAWRHYSTKCRRR